MILVRAGETDAALDPNWDPIRDDPRFRALLRNYAEPGT